MLRRWMQRRARLQFEVLDDEEAHEEDVTMAFIRTEMVRNESRSRYAGSVVSHHTIDRGRIEGYECLLRDYFVHDSVYGARLFRRRFRMRRPLLVRIIEAVKAHDPYFVQKRNAAHVLGLSPEQKVTTAMRMLCYGVAADAVEEYVRIGSSTATESLKRFVRAVCEVFGGQYLRSPTVSDTARILAHSEARGFPGMLGSIDCMPWRWKNYPSAWQGQYSGHFHEPTIILEAVATHDLWIWHVFFGLPGSLNDINVLHRSLLFQRLALGEAPSVNYTINGHNYSMGYYLADGIYPRWATFMKTITAPQGNKKKHFAKMQEGARKDVERAFGVLQPRFAIVRGPARFWDQEDLGFIMRTCIILHNMIVENEGEDASADLLFDGMGETVAVHHGFGETPLWQFVSQHQSITNSACHSQLQADLMGHLWQHHGDM